MVKEFAGPRTTWECCRALRNWGYWITFDYLSSVSGGGYIHEWFAAWIKREEQEQEQLAADATPPTTYSPPMGFGEVQKRLVPLPSDQDSPAHPEPIRWLRRYSNYLTPQKGLFIADTWVAIAIWFRNTFLNQLILLSFLFFLLLIPNLVAKPITKLSADWSILAATLYLFAVAWTAITLRHEYVRISPLDNYTGADEKPEEPERFGGEKTVQILVVTPLLLASVLHLSFVLRLPDHGPMSMAYLLELPFVFGLLWALVFAVAFAGASTETYRALHGLLKKPEEPGKQPEKLKEKLKILVSRFYRGVRIAVNGVGALVIGNAMVSAFAGTLLFIGVRWALGWMATGLGCSEPWRLQTVFGPPLLFSVPLFTLVIGADTFTLTMLGTNALYAGQYDEAWDWHSRALSIDRARLWANLLSPAAPLYAGQLEKAADAIRSAAQVLPKDPLLSSYEALLWAKRGERRKAEQLIQKATHGGGSLLHTHHMMHTVAAAYGELGKPQPALAWLRKASTNGLPLYPVYRDDPHFECMRNQPQFLRFMANLKKEWTSYQRFWKSGSRAVVGCHKTGF